MLIVESGILDVVSAMIRKQEKVKKKKAKNMHEMMGMAWETRWYGWTEQ